MPYDSLLKLCGWEADQIAEESPRLEEAFGILGLGPEDMALAEARVKDGYDVSLMGVHNSMFRCE